MPIPRIIVIPPEFAIATSPDHNSESMPNNTLLFRNGSVILPDRVIADSAVVCSDGRITLSLCAGWASYTISRVMSIDFAAGWHTPKH